MAAVAASRMRALVTLAIAAAVMAAAATISPANANAADVATTKQRCGWVSKAGSWSYLCYAPSTYYPNQVGNYAWIGRPGQCGIEPFTGYLGGAVTAICGAAPVYDGWAVRKGQWAKVMLSSNERGYIHPYAGSSSWRWVYVSSLQEWVAVSAADVGILWKVQ